LIRTGEGTVANQATIEAGARSVVEGEFEVTALALSPEVDEVLVGLANGSVNLHRFPSGNHAR